MEILINSCGVHKTTLEKLKGDYATNKALPNGWASETSSFDEYLEREISKGRIVILDEYGCHRKEN